MNNDSSKKCVLKSPHKREDYTDYLKKNLLGYEWSDFKHRDKACIYYPCILCKKASESSADFDCCCLHYMVRCV